MIKVTRINGTEEFFVNENKIEFMEETPDTVISLESGKKSSEEDIKWFGSNPPDPILYAPEGYVETIRLKLDFTDEQLAAVQLAANGAATAQSAYLTSVADSGENSPATKLKKQNLDNALAKFNETLEKSYVARAADMEPILEQLRGGGDFFATMEKLSEDQFVTNYYVHAESTHVEEAYRTAAMALENPGDISDVVRIEGGVCIIQLVEKVQPGVRPYEEVKEALKEALINARIRSEESILENEYAQKAFEANIVQMYLDKL